jgi:hypothetical protein
MREHLQAIVTVLSLVNPLISGAMFVQIEAGQDRATRLADATRVALSVLLILSIAALAGARVLPEPARRRKAAGAPRLRLMNAEGTSARSSSIVLVRP